MIKIAARAIHSARSITFKPDSYSHTQYLFPDLSLIHICLIIIPQAFKNVLPALINEMIVLLKETAIIGYIGTIDITKAATLVQSRTYDALVPLLSAAIFYLILVMILTYFMGKLERRLRKSDH